MKTLIIVCIVGSALCFVLGILIAEVVNNRKFWNRQNFMERINRKFQALIYNGNKKLRGLYDGQKMEKNSLHQAKKKMYR